VGNWRKNGGGGGILGKFYGWLVYIYFFLILWVIEFYLNLMVLGRVDHGPNCLVTKSIIWEVTLTGKYTKKLYSLHVYIAEKLILG
jgi:hypothetical protein